MGYKYKQKCTDQKFLDMALFNKNKKERQFVNAKKAQQEKERNARRTAAPKVQVDSATVANNVAALMRRPVAAKPVRTVAAEVERWKAEEIQQSNTTMTTGDSDEEHEKDLIALTAMEEDDMDLQALEAMKVAMTPTMTASEGGEQMEDMEV